MNHGRCERCGWWEKLFSVRGICHMSKTCSDEKKVTDNDGYCPDYVNMKKFKYNEKSID